MFKRKLVSTHRLSYLIHKGHIPTGMVVMHSCDNASCVNPEHLSLGTFEENRLDMVNKKRQVRGSKVNTSKLTAEQVLSIRADRRPQIDIANHYGVSATAIRKIHSRENWRHL